MHRPVQGNHAGMAFFGREAMMDVISDILDMIGEIVEIIEAVITGRKTKENERSKENDV